MSNGDYLDPHAKPGMPNFVADPTQKKAYEEEARQQLQNVSRQRPAPAQQEDMGKEKVILRNNRAHAQHFVGDNVAIVIPGQVSQEPKGPFNFVDREVLESEMPLLMALESRSNGRRAPLSIIDKETYMREYREFQEKRKEREKVDAQHRSLEGDEMDSAQEDFKVNHNVLENVQPDRPVPEVNEGNSETISPRINLD